MDEMQKNDPLAWLDEKHELYEQFDTNERWKKWRAVLDEFDDDATKKRFLKKTEVEIGADYKFRVEASEFNGITSAAITRICDAVFGVPAKIDTTNKIVEQFILNCDGCGTTLVDFFESISPEAQGMGLALAVIDRAPAPQGGATNFLQESQSGSLQCFVSLYRVEELWNYNFDPNGDVKSVVLARRICDQGELDAEPKYFDERRLITKTSTTVYRREVDEGGTPKEGARYRLEKTADHNLGVVPVVDVYGTFRSKMVGFSMHRAAIKSDVARFQEESWAMVTRYRHANQILALKSDRELKEIVAGPVFRLLQDEDLKYVSPSSVGFDASENAIKRMKQDAIASTGMNPATADSPTTANGESGIAQRVRFTHTEKRAIDRHARSIERAIMRVLDIVERWTSKVKPSKPSSTVSIFTTFDSFEIDANLRTYTAAQFLIESPTWHREMLKRIATQSMPDADEAVKKSIESEIDKQPIADPASRDPNAANHGG